MPHITAATVKEIRKEIKAEFKGMKFSVTTENHSKVCVALMEGNIECEKDYMGINHLWMKQHGISEEIVEMVEKILVIINKHQKQTKESDDADYGSIPSFYIDIQIGKWDKAYKKIA